MNAAEQISERSGPRGLREDCDVNPLMVFEPKGAEWFQDSVLEDYGNDVRLSGIVLGHALHHRANSMVTGACCQGRKSSRC